MVTVGQSPTRRSYRLEIFFVSFAALLLEISYTRVISFKLFYYYTYLVIGLALLGIGCGGVLVAISSRLRRASTDAVLMWSTLLGACSVGIGYIVIARTSLDTLAIWDYGTAASFANAARLVLICLVLFASFISVGLVIATLFARKPDAIGGLYFADLVGAGLACAIVVWLLGGIGPPATIALSGLVLALTGLKLAIGNRSRVWLPGAALVALLCVVVVSPQLLPEQRVDATKTPTQGAEPLYSSWSALFRVDAYYLNDDTLLLFHDGLYGSIINRFDGDVSTLDRFDSDVRGLPFGLSEEPRENVLIIGAAGGHEVLASLYFDAGHIDAVELNPVTYDLMTNELADYSGNLADNPKVDYINGEGRTYLRRSDDEYNLIWFPAPDSYSATNAATSGAFVLSESYLYTTETIVESFEHLSPDGVIAAQFGEVDYEAKPNRTTRYVATAREALKEIGIDDPSDHIAVATTPGTNSSLSVSTILVKREPFTAAEIAELQGASAAVAGTQLRYVPSGEPRDQGDVNTVTAVATLSDEDLEAWYEDYTFDVRPITDNGPFFWHFVPFDDVIADFANPIQYDDPEQAVGERVLLLLLGVSAVLAAIFLLTPFLAIRRQWTELPHKRRSALYFAAIGLGFMFFEITLIQKLTLFLGYPTYSLTVTLASILIFTGIGALLSERIHLPPARLVTLLFVALAGLTVFYQAGLPRLTDALLGASLGVRVLVTLVVLAPLGMLLGLFMPFGLRAIAHTTAYARQYVAWGWAVNGFASVVGATLTTILAMSFGFRFVLMLALGVYAVALTALWSLLREDSSVAIASPDGGGPGLDVDTLSTSTEHPPTSKVPERR